MVNRFDPLSKPLDKAKPCIVELMRDNGNVEWYEGAKSGQLLQIMSGNNKSYVNLDHIKIRNIAGEPIDMQGVNDPEQVVTVESEIDGKPVKKKTKLKNLMGKIFSLSSNKKKNFGTVRKPVMGFICYEKEFNALPTKVTHDSKQVAGWLDYIQKNIKSLDVQKIESWKGFAIAVGVLIIFGIVAFFWFGGGDYLLAKQAAEAAAQTVVVP